MAHIHNKNWLINGVIQLLAVTNTGYGFRFSGKDRIVIRRDWKEEVDCYTSVFIGCNKFGSALRGYIDNQLLSQNYRNERPCTRAVLTILARMDFTVIRSILSELYGNPFSYIYALLLFRVAFLLLLATPDQACYWI
jgi:hypothetical protein